MQAPTVANEFFQLLVKSKLLSEEQLRQAIEALSLDESMPPKTVARTMINNRMLTPFQAERLLEGRYRGFVIDGYRVREVLGIGGMGCVYIAEDHENNRKVALKVLASHHNTDPGMLARLKLEAMAGMKIKHPNVIETYKVDSTGAVNYMVMELMRGISLHELVAIKGPMKWGSACDVFSQIANGLQAAHDNRIIHRDIKPANILIAADGLAKLLDFGLAKVEEGKRDEFSLAMIFGHDCLGTPDYIPPEQAKDSAAVDETADIYSLGCTFYVALTGRVPFPQKKNSEKITAHRTMKPRPIKEIRRDVPDDLIAIIEKMMAKLPADRFQSAAELVTALKPYCKRRPVEFDFRELVTLRARQARDREKTKSDSQRKRPSTNSSITSSAGWMGNSSHHLQADLDTLAAGDTPAIRQPAPGPSRSTQMNSRPAATRGVYSNNRNVPQGWSVRPLKPGRAIALVRVKNRVGTASECELPLKDSVADSRQCYIEFDGTNWVMHQESLKVPTLVDGKNETVKVLKHGSKLSFSDGSGFVLNSQAGVLGEKKRKRILWIALACTVAVAVASSIAMAIW